MQERKGKKKSSVLVRSIGLLLPTVLLLLLSQTAFAKNAYVITDGERVLYHTTYATNPEEVLSEAGLALSADDTYTTTPGPGVSEITVRRSQNVTIDYCGEMLQVTARGETVSELLARMNITVDELTNVSVPLDAVTYDGMLLTVSKTAYRIETYTVAIPYETEYCQDSSLPQGQTAVLTSGMDGQMTCRANVKYVNGAEVDRTVLSQSVHKEPVNEVVAIGTGADLETLSSLDSGLKIGDGYLILPTGEMLTYRDTLQMNATAYTHTDPGCNEVTATGTTVHIGTVAVDPRMIPYGTRMVIVSNDGKYVYGVATAEDCGGSIKQNRVDLYFPTTEECLAFGRRVCTVFILGSSQTSE